MIHLIAIVLGILVLLGIVGFFYVIHSVLSHFGLATEEIAITALVLFMVAFFAWMFGSIALELIGII